MLDRYSHSIHAVVAIAMLGIVLVGCSTGNGGGDEGTGEEGVGEGASEGIGEGSGEGEPSSDGAGEGVGEPNHAPILASIGNKQVDEERLLEFTIVAADHDTIDILTYRGSNLPPNSSFDSETRTFSWTPAFGDSGSFQDVLFTVTDDGLPPLSDSESITITVGDVNRPPEMNPIGDRQVDEGALLEFVVSATDPDGDELSYSRGNLPPGSSFDSETQTFSWTPLFGDAGSFQDLLFVVSDDGTPPLSDLETITITVGNVNRPPELNAVGHQQVEEGAVIEFVVTATDPDGDGLSFSVDNLPPGASFDSDTQTFSWTPAFGDSGSFQDVSFTVTDDGLPPLNDSESITITVGDVNRPPELNAIGNQQVDEGVLLEFVVTGTDPDGDQLAYSVSNLPSRATFDTATQTFSWTPEIGDAGEYADIVFTVTEVGSAALNDSVTLSITVNDASEAVPDVVGLTQALAETTISESGFVLGAITEAFDDSVPEGNIVSQNPEAGTEELLGTAINLTVSLGQNAKAGFVILPSSGVASLETQFFYTDPFKADLVTSWAWDFESDGIVDSTEAEPAHTYDEPGLYDVTLTITTTSGVTSQLVRADCVFVRERIETVVQDGILFVFNESDWVFAGKTDNSLVLEYSGSEADPLTTGQIVVGMEEDGYARRIASIAVNGGTYTLETEPVALTDIFTQADVFGVAEITEQDFKRAGVPFDKDGGAFVSLDGITLAGAVRLDGEIEFDPSLDFDLRITGGRAEYFKSLFTGRLDLSFDASFALGADVELLEVEESVFELLSLSKPSNVSVFFAGFVPVIVFTQFDVKVGVVVSTVGDVSLDAGFDSSTVVSFGPQFSDGEWSLLGEVGLDAHRHGPVFELKAGLEARIFAKMEIFIRLYGVAGPSAAVIPYLSASAGVLPAPGAFTMSAGADADIEFDLIDLDVIDDDFDVGVAQTFELFSREFGSWPLASEQSAVATPSFTVSPRSGVVPLEVTFRDSSDPGTGALTAWHWDFGDGMSSKAQNPTHIYREPGVYRVSQTVEGSAGSADWADTIIIRATSGEIPPNAEFTAVPTAGLVPLTVQFTDSSDPGSSVITDWAWDFDGDGVVDSFEQNPSWTYDTTGTYDVRLVVSNSVGTGDLLRRGFVKAIFETETESFMLPGDVELDMLSIPAGTFMMGSDNGNRDEMPAHEVTLSQNFQIGKFEVTKAQWEAVMGTTPWSGQTFVLDDPNSPATHVSWNDAQAFIAALNSLTGKTFRLPTEAEREHACRAGTRTEYTFGDSSANLSNYAWWDENADGVGEGYAHIVGQLLPNAFGLFDMHGNVWEWCDDWYGPDFYSTSPSSDPTGPASGSFRVFRGGSWFHNASLSRSAFRCWGYPSGANHNIGFRLAR